MQQTIVLDIDGVHEHIRYPGLSKVVVPMESVSLRLYSDASRESS